VFYNHCRPAIGRLFPRLLPEDSAGVAKLAEHITQFSLAAMRSLTVKQN
jgi:hypothetical protein